MNIPELVEALAGLAWPVLTAVVLWRLFPLAREIAKSRAFTIKVGGMELSVQEATEQLRSNLEDLQKKVEELRAQRGNIAAAAAPAGLPTISAPRRIAWVDDKPAHNALEIARLRDDGVEVVQLSSTEDALRVLVEGQLTVSAVISDMARREGVTYNWRAGVELIEQLRRAGVTVPIFVYGSAKAVERTRDQVLAAGGNGATASAVELFEMLRETLNAAA